MLLHPGILALLLGATLVLLMLLTAAGLGVKILARWDFRSSSEGQLALERQTYLVSTLMQYALGFEVLSGFLFIYTVDDLHPLFVGAMCATGTLNANPVGWQVLWLKLGIFFAGALWLGLNHLDQQAEDVPLVRLKYALLLPLLPLVGLDLAQQARYFLGLSPDIITSCCGSLFSSGGAGLAAEVAALPVRPTMIAFYALLTLTVGVGLLCLRRRGVLWRILFALLSLASFTLSLAAVVSFISLYIYELPTHHCPFDILQRGYHFIGYPLYLSLFCGALFGLLPGMMQPLKRFPSLSEPLLRAERSWLRLSLAGWVVFLLLASWPVVFGHLVMYY